MVFRVLSHGQQDLSIGRGDQRLPEGVEGPRRLDRPLLELFSVVEHDALAYRGQNVDLEKGPAVLHSSRVTTAQVDPDLVGVDAWMVIAHVTGEERQMSISCTRHEAWKHLLSPNYQGPVTLVRRRLGDLGFPEVVRIRLERVAREHLGGHGFRGGASFSEERRSGRLVRRRRGWHGCAVVESGRKMEKGRGKDEGELGR